MSYITKNTIHSYLYVQRNSYVSITGSYGHTTSENGFPFDSTAISGGNLVWSTTNYTATIKTKGLYLVSYTYTVKNNTNDALKTSEINVGFNLVSGSTNKIYYSITNPEYSVNNIRYTVSKTVYISCEIDDIIKGYIYKDTREQFIEKFSCLSIALITPFY
jgi:hypothetical protein